MNVEVQAEKLSNDGFSAIIMYGLEQISIADRQGMDMSISIGRLDNLIDFLYGVQQHISGAGTSHDPN